MQYDVLVIGGGPAGISAAIYAKRAGKQVAIIEKFAMGGQINLIGSVENYLGFTSLDGPDLAAEFAAHAKALEIPVIYTDVKGYDFTSPIKKVICRKTTYEAKSVILALGCHSRPLGIDGEDKFKGRGVSYCAVCDGNFFKGKRVAVVGSGDTAVSDAIYLSGICAKTYLICDELHLTSHSTADIKNNHINLISHATATQILGNDGVEGVTLSTEQGEKTLSLDAIFVAVGRAPQTQSLKGKVRLDKNGYIKTDARMHTSVAGVFACGDVRSNSLKQISTAVGDGALAGTEAVKFVALNDVLKYNINI